MALKLINYLKDPQLVASIQQFFGVKIHYEGLEDSKTSQNEDNEYICEKVDNYNKNHVLTCRNKEINGCNTNNKQFNGCIRQTESAKQKDDSRKNQNPHYTITNLFWYYLFLFGTELGDEMFYCTFIPFLFWNIDGAIGRRVVLVWATVMSSGQILKDVIRWPRPACPPAVRLQNKWSQEYGMPSTHAMVGLTIPFSIVFFTMDKYIYSFPIGCAIAFVWCALVSMSRLYLGMHTILDVVTGLILAIALMIPLVPLVEMTNFYIITNVWSLAILIAISIATIVYYPCSDKWTPTRSDTAMVVSVTAGIHAGSWLSYCTGALSTSLLSPPYNIVWPTAFTLGHLILRTVIGFAGVMATKVLCKFLSYITTCAILGVNWRELIKCQDYSGNQNKVFVDLVYRYISCFMIGMNTVYFLPHTFSMIGIERPRFCTEM